VGLHIEQARRNRTCHICGKVIRGGDHLVEITLTYNSRYLYNNICLPCFYRFFFRIQKKIAPVQNHRALEEAIRRFQDESG